MRGRLQQPLLGRGAVTARCCEEAPVPAVRRGEVGLVEQPAVVACGTRYWIGKIMLRKSPPVIRTHSWASRAPIGWKSMKPGMRADRPCRGWPPPRRCARRCRRSPSRGRERVGRPPRSAAPERRVLGQQVVEDRRAGAGLADDDDRAGDRGVGHLRVVAAPGGDPEPVRSGSRAEVADRDLDDRCRSAAPPAAAQSSQDARAPPASCPRRSRPPPWRRSRRRPTVRDRVGRRPAGLGRCLRPRPWHDIMSSDADRRSFH